MKRRDIRLSRFHVKDKPFRNVGNWGGGEDSITKGCRAEGLKKA